ncbi:MAG: FAD-dependent oxidoreductase [Deltaproteobacteria bacterium]|nr:FAD-dependent oxidoreductase [Deltaproteobacteria bacterium]
MSDRIIYSSEPEDFYYMGINIPCQGACPAGTNIPAYIRALYEMEYGRSYDINRMANIFPGVLGRICSRPCEDKCRHGESELGDPVNICHIKRAASDFRGASVTPIKRVGSLSNKVAIAGAGPAGLAAAHELAILGFSVTIYEAFEKPGGMLRYGIPEFRLPRNILEKEIAEVLSLGVDLKTGIRIGSDMQVDDILAEYDALLAATGCYRAVSMNIRGEDLKGVHSGLEFMIKVCSGERPVLGEKVLVIGAGFTAFDCARTALRLGAKDVRICLRRTEQDLRVTRHEIMETKKEGVKIESLLLSQEITGAGKVEGVKFLRTGPGKTGKDGKQGIHPIEGSMFTIQADSVIVATGQASGPFDSPGDKDKNGVLTVDRSGFLTSHKRLYAAGDYVTGPSTVIESIAMGRRAAHKIALDLTGRSFIEKAVRQETAQITDRQRAWDFIPGHEMPTLSPVSERLAPENPEVETGLSPEQAHEESKRCYLCYLHYEIDMERCIYCRYCMDVAPRDCIKLVNEVKLNEHGAIACLKEASSWEDVNAIMIDNARCIRCGECVRVCPMDCISVTRVELIERQRRKVKANNI